MPRPVPAHLLGIAALLATGCTEQPGEQQRQPFACNETRDGSRCIEAADGSTWDVLDAVVSPNQDGDRALVAVDSSLKCPFDGPNVSNPEHSAPVLCRDLVGFDADELRYARQVLDFDGIGLLPTVDHLHGLFTPDLFPIIDDVPFAGAVSSAWFSTCDREAQGPDGVRYRTGHVDALTNGEVRIVSADDTEAIIEIDFPEARGRLRARVCEPW